MKKIGMIVLFSLFLLAMPVPALGASTELAPYLEDLDMEQIDAAAEDAVEDVTFSELVEDVLTGDFSFSMEDLWEKLGEVAFGELRTQTGLIMQLIAVSILAAVLRQVSGSFCGREVGEMGFYVCYMVLIVVIITTFYDITAMVVERVEQTADIFGAMLPVFLALAASSGNLTQTALMGTHHDGRVHPHCIDIKKCCCSCVIGGGGSGIGRPPFGTTSYSQICGIAAAGRILGAERTGRGIYAAVVLTEDWRRSGKRTGSADSEDCC